MMSILGTPDIHHLEFMGGGGGKYTREPKVGTSQVSAISKLCKSFSAWRWFLTCFMQVTLHLCVTVIIRNRLIWILTLLKKKAVAQEWCYQQNSCILMAVLGVQQNIQPAFRCCFSYTLKVT